MTTLYRKVKQGKRHRYEPVGNGNGERLLRDPLDVVRNERMADLAQNATTLSERNLSTLLGRLLDPRRDYYHELGFPTTESLVAEDYKRLYDRESIASRVVDVMIKECMQQPPDIVEDEDVDNVTDFEKACKQLGKGLRKESWYRGKDYPIIDAYLARAARLSRIGHFGVILLGLDDGLPLNEPVKGVVEEGSLPTGEVENREYVDGDDPLCPTTNEDEPRLRKFLKGRHIPTEAPTLNGPLPRYSLTVNHPAGGHDQKSHAGKGGTVYHGTAVSASESILEQGLLLSKSRHPEIWAGDKKIALDYAVENGSGWIDDDTYVAPKDVVAAVVAIDSSFMTGSGGLAISDKDVPPNAIRRVELFKMRENPSPGGPPYIPEQKPFKILKGKGVQNMEGDSEVWAPITIEEMRRYSTSTNQSFSANRGLSLSYLRVFDESAVDITRYETNPQSPRFGHPVEYTITMEMDAVGPSRLGTMGHVTRTQRVHWTRAVHINGGDLDSSELFHVPSIRPVLNNVINLHKVYGADAEGYWRGGLTAHSIETHPQLGADVELDWDDLKDGYEEFQHSSSRVFGMAGVSMKQHAPSVVDPTSHIQIQLDAICIKLGMPKRVFMGSERGELSSSEDKGTWNERKQAFCSEILTGQVYLPFYDRLILLKVLPEPTFKTDDDEQGYDVVWPEQELMNPSERAQVAVQRVDAMTKYVQGDLANTLMDPMDFFVRELGYDERDAEAILEALVESMGEDQDDEAAGRSPLLGLVGGVTGMAELFAKRAEGAIADEELVGLIKLFYGLNDAKAKALVVKGKPPKVTVEDDDQPGGKTQPGGNPFAQPQQGNPPQANPQPGNPSQGNQ